MVNATCFSLSEELARSIANGQYVAVCSSTTAKGASLVDEIYRKGYLEAGSLRRQGVTWRHKTSGGGFTVMVPHRKTLGRAPDRQFYA